MEPRYVSPPFPPASPDLENFASVPLSLISIGNCNKFCDALGGEGVTPLLAPPLVSPSPTHAESRQPFVLKGLRVGVHGGVIAALSHAGV